MIKYCQKGNRVAHKELVECDLLTRFHIVVAYSGVFPLINFQSQRNYTLLFDKIIIALCLKISLDFLIS